MKGNSGANNMSENNYELVEIPYSFSRAPLMPSIGNLSLPFYDLSPIKESGNYSIQKSLGKNTPPTQNTPP